MLRTVISDKCWEQAVCWNQLIAKFYLADYAFSTPFCHAGGLDSL